MKSNTSYKDYIIYDVLGHIDGVSAKAMFGGWGIYKDGLIVGIIAEGELYLKADALTMKRLKKEGCYPFVYDGHKHKTVTMPYMSVPEETLEDREKMSARVEESYTVSKKK